MFKAANISMLSLLLMLNQTSNYKSSSVLEITKSRSLHHQGAGVHKSLAGAPLRLSGKKEVSRLGTQHSLTRQPLVKF